MLFYFDMRDGDLFHRDNAGVELPDVEAAKTLATRELAALAGDMSEGLADRRLAFEVRDAKGRALFQVSLSFEISDSIRNREGNSVDLQSAEVGNLIAFHRPALPRGDRK